MLAASRLGAWRSGLRPGTSPELVAGAQRADALVVAHRVNIDSAARAITPMLLLPHDASRSAQHCGTPPAILSTRWRLRRLRPLSHSARPMRNPAPIAARADTIAVTPR